MFFKRESKALFLVHGFTDNVEYNFKNFINYVESHSKIDCVAYDLHGHSKEENIEDFDHKKCIEEIEVKYQEAKEKYDKVYLLGFSMGGVIASHLASKFGCDKLVLLAPAFKYIESSGLAENLFDIIQTDIKRSSFKDIFLFNEKSSIEKYVKQKYKNEKVVFSKYFTGDISTSLKPYINFVMLVDKLDKNLDFIDIPTRVYIGEKDELVPVKSALHIYKKIIAKDKMLKVLPHVYHELLESSLRDDLSKEILKFIKKRED